MCIDSAAKRGDMHKPVGLYPCHNQGGNQVKLYLLNCLNVTAKFYYFFCSFGYLAKMAKFVVMRLAWISPAMMSFSTHAMALRATNCGPMMMMSVFSFINCLIIVCLLIFIFTFLVEANSARDYRSLLGDVISKGQTARTRVPSI